MEQLGTVLARRAESPASSSDTRISPTPPANSCSRQEFVWALAALVALKRTASLDKPQIDAWYAVLGQFPARVVNAAIVELCLTEIRFPEVGDVYQICRRHLPKGYSPLGDGKETDRPSKSEIEAVAQRLGLNV